MNLSLLYPPTPPTNYYTYVDGVYVPTEEALLYEKTREAYWRELKEAQTPVQIPTTGMINTYDKDLIPENIQSGSSALTLLPHVDLPKVDELGNPIVVPLTEEQKKEQSYKNTKDIINLGGLLGFVGFGISMLKGLFKK